MQCSADNVATNGVGWAGGNCGGALRTEDSESRIRDSGLGSRADVDSTTLTLLLHWQWLDNRLMLQATRSDLQLEQKKSDHRLQLQPKQPHSSYAGACRDSASAAAHRNQASGAWATTATAARPMTMALLDFEGPEFPVAPRCSQRSGGGAVARSLRSGALSGLKDLNSGFSVVARISLSVHNRTSSSD